ncbi:MAG: STAS domain-containing protein [Bacteroidetes bacterium]|nr:STAS domain-containing protein [Bacteroidota bacterium]MCB0843784.1 STAS domain-containing protein [Bacteroidota bacterium]MCB0850785.1 STAS domain-containing protein [Bacteroidota bacterium]
MEIKEEIKQAYISLFPCGELDANSSIDLDERIAELIEKGQYNIHVNLEDVTYISSAGLGVFISHLDILNTHNGKMVLSNLTESVEYAFNLLGLNQLITIAKEGEEIDLYFENE